MLLNDKIAVVTGAATGIGEAVARLFASEGARVHLWDRDGGRNDATAAAIRAESGFAEPRTCDVSDGEAVASAMREVLDRSGRVDILVNNAGIYPRRSFLEMTERDWDEMQDVNLKSMFYCIKAALPHMVARKAGKIVNISSVTFHLGTANLSHYVASKGGVIGLTRSLARETGAQNVHVNCITPGAIEVEAERKFVTDEQIRYMVGEQSIKRRLVPLDIARVCVFLCCELSDAMTGQVLNVDGGWHMH